MTAPRTLEERSTKGQLDVALLLATSLILLGWVDLFLFPVSPLGRSVIGPWWGLIWLGPLI